MSGLAHVEGRVLSAQSHVVHGNVGNRCAGFALQLLGFEVDVLNTVQFSNHTGYPSVKGSKLTGGEFVEIVDTMRANGLTEGFTHLLTGYIGSVDFLGGVHDVLKKLKEENPALVYVCDPVMGDNGRLYVSEDMVPAFKQLVRHADVLTPNQFEAETLTDTKISSLADAVKTCDIFHEMGVSRVILTSLELPSAPGSLLILGSDKEQGLFMVRVPKLVSYFTGTGDLMAAVLLGQSHIKSSLGDTLAHAVASVQAAIRITQDHYETQVKEAENEGKDTETLPKSWLLNARELRLVAARREIMSPSELPFSAEKIDRASLSG